MPKLKIWTPEKLAIRAEKTKQTCLLKYGVDNPFKSTIIKNKIKNKKIELYNNINYNNREKANNTCLQKYGVQHPIQNKNIQSQITIARTNSFVLKLFDGTRLNRMVIPLFNPNDFTTVQDFYQFECISCHTIFNSNIEDGKIPKCPSCFARNNVSMPEIEFLDHLHIIDRQKYIKPYKVDGIKNKKIFEFLGDYWHGNPQIFLSDGMNYSAKTTFGELYIKTIKKFVELKAQGYDIYYVWENEWNRWKQRKQSSFPLRKYKENIII